MKGPSPRQSTTFAEGGVATGAIGLLGLVAVAIGLALVSPALRFDPSGSAQGIAGQLSTTVPAAVMTVLASAANLLAGAVLVRIARRRPFRSLSELVLMGFLGAVLFDLALVYVLAGSVPLFTWPALVAVHAGVLALGSRVRPLLACSLSVCWRPSPLWALIAVAWSGPILLQLASPVVPFFDVLPNHVAPVEHLRIFASYDPLSTSPSPAYGPSRLSLGYLALLGTVTTLTGLPAALSVSAFIAVEVIVVAIGLRYLATALGGPGAGLWVLVTFTLTQPFARLADDRSRIVALPLVALTLAEVVRAIRRERRRSSETRQSEGAAALVGAGIGATLLVHMVMGVFTSCAIMLAAVVAPARISRMAVPALAAGAGLALPQAVVMLGLPLRPPAGLLAIPLAVVALWIGGRPRVPESVVVVSRMAVIGLLGVAAWLLASRPEAFGLFLASLPALGVLLGAALIGAPLIRRRLSQLVLGASVAVGVGAGVAANLVPQDRPSLLFDAIRFEIPKEVLSWLPFVLSLCAALGIDSLLRRSRLAALAGGRIQRAVAIGSVALFVLLAALPLRGESIDSLWVGEHRISESLAISLRQAESGYWVDYADTRQLAGAGQRAVLEVLRDEVRQGRIDARTEVLHLAWSFHQWAATPIGVFTGITETVLAPDATITVHSVGGRLYSLSTLESLLAEAPGRFAYVILEPLGLPPDLGALITDHGYAPIFSNVSGTVFRLLDADGQ